MLIDGQTAVLKLNCELGSLRWMVTTQQIMKPLCVCMCVCVYMFAHVRACVSVHILTSSHLCTYLLFVACFYIATFMCIVSVEIV